MDLKEDGFRTYRYGDDVNEDCCFGVSLMGKMGNGQFGYNS